MATDPCKTISANRVVSADPRPPSGVTGGSSVGPANYFYDESRNADYVASKYTKQAGFYKNYRGVSISESLEFYQLNARTYSLNTQFSAGKRAKWERTLSNVSALIEQAGTAESNVWILLSDDRLELCTPLVNPIHGPSPFGVKRASPPKTGKGASPMYNIQNPGEKLYRYHNGIDYHTKKNGLGINQPCYSIADGTVILSGLLGSAGLTIRIDHGFGITSRYLHLRDLKVKKGDVVKKGQVIGLCGDSEGGKDDAGKPVAIHGKGFPHLHFEIRINQGTFESPPTARGSLNSDETNFPIDPGPLLVNAPNPGEPASAKATTNLQVDLAKLSDLATTSGSRQVVSNALTAYDQIASAVRAEALSGMTRRTAYAAETSASSKRELRRDIRTNLPMVAVPEQS